jgi:hypothetical protein
MLATLLFLLNFFQRILEMSRIVILILPLPLLPDATMCSLIAIMAAALTTTAEMSAPVMPSVISTSLSSLTEESISFLDV